MSDIITGDSDITIIARDGRLLIVTRHVMSVDQIAGYYSKYGACTTIWTRVTGAILDLLSQNGIEAFPLFSDTTNTSDVRRYYFLHSQLRYIIDNPSPRVRVVEHEYISSQAAITLMNEWEKEWNV